MSSTSEPMRREIALLLLLVTLVFSVVLQVLDTEISLVVIRTGLSADARSAILFFVGILGILAAALPLFAATATRLPMAAVALTVLALGAQLLYTVVRFGQDLASVRPLWGLLFAVTAVVLDLVVLRYAGRALPVLPVVLAAVVIAVLRVAVSLAQIVAFAGSLVVAGSLTFWLSGLLLAPALLIGAAVAGWSVSLRSSPRPVPAAG